MHRHLKDQVSKAQQKEQREERERLARLRMNDEEGYRKLINKEKHGRLAQLLDKTDEYMSQMMSQIEDHRQEEIAKERKKKGQEVSFEAGTSEGACCGVSV